MKFILIIWILQTSWLFGQAKFLRSNEDVGATLVTINKLSMWIHEDGVTANDPSGGPGATYPRGTGSVIFSDGVLWGGQVKDGRLIGVGCIFPPAPSFTRVGGTVYSSGLLPGRIIERGVAEDPVAPDVRIWRIRRDWQTADLEQDAAEFFNLLPDSITDAEINFVRAQYETDWLE